MLCVETQRPHNGGRVATNIDGRRLATWIAIALLVPVLQGCSAGVIALNAIPTTMNLVSVMGSDNRDPFEPRKPDLRPPADGELTRFGTQIERAECGDAAAQFWLASQLQNNFNAAPDRVEIYKWYQLARIGKHPAAGVELTALGATMSEPDVARAQSLASEWRPRTEGCPEPESKV